MAFLDGYRKAFQNQGVRSRAMRWINGNNGGTIELRESEAFAAWRRLTGLINPGPCPVVLEFADGGRTVSGAYPRKAFLLNRSDKYLEVISSDLLWGQDWDEAFSDEEGFEYHKGEQLGFKVQLWPADRFKVVVPRSHWSLILEAFEPQEEDDEEEPRPKRERPQRPKPPAKPPKPYDPSAEPGRQIGG
jgi:hypothetical protein